MTGKRTNAEWIADLTSEGIEQERALIDLRKVIVKGLPFALSKWLSRSDPQLDDLVEEVAQETLLRVLSRLDTFEGRSQFTTWVQKIAVRLAITELRRKRWQDTSLDGLLEMDGSPLGSRLLIDTAPGPERSTRQIEMLEKLEQIIEGELTEKQRRAMVAVRIHGMPMEEVARRMGMTRNALYKLLHDARLRLKKHLDEQGLNPEEVIAEFEV
jgi:RNA polymerase sigma-70 factor (ECF subfamily)